MDNQSGAQFAQARAAEAGPAMPPPSTPPEVAVEEEDMGQDQELKSMVRSIVMEVLQEMQGGMQS